ncbi:RHS domain-containing protein [Burkholderia ubonensis]|uniref:RHS domain-containing protein n=1 Tax=Burkholderia ubonensis TaxID=101571 RepID=UPI000A4E02ED
MYDALGRHIAKLTEPQVPYLVTAGSCWRDAERRRLTQEHGYGLTLHRWDGDMLAYYHCDQIGAPQEVTDEAGEIAWSAHNKAWGEAREVISEAARKAGITNPLRFVGQHFDRETGRTISGSGTMIWAAVGSLARTRSGWLEASTLTSTHPIRYSGSTR